jgi:hypothetical protein
MLDTESVRRHIFICFRLAESICETLTPTNRNGRLAQNGLPCAGEGMERSMAAIAALALAVTGRSVCAPGVVIDEADVRFAPEAGSWSRCRCVVIPTFAPASSIHDLSSSAAGSRP